MTALATPTIEAPEYEVVLDLLRKGVPVAPVQTARVLEVGSAVGGHLLPMAMALPGAHFTGFDLAEEQVARASAAAKELGLTNVTFVEADIREFEPDPGTFDFVIAHGIYSWVPPDVRDALLALVKAAEGTPKPA